MTHELSADRYDAVLFDLDGVRTDTAAVHADAWKTMFNEYLRSRDEPFREFTIAGDYKTYVDGKPRYDGVRSFLGSRDIELPEGGITDAPDVETVRGPGNRKNDMVNRPLDEQGVAVYGGSVRLVHRLRDQGIRLGVVSSSRNRRAVLEADIVVDDLGAQVL